MSSARFDRHHPNLILAAPLREIQRSIGVRDQIADGHLVRRNRDADAHRRPQRSNLGRARFLDALANAFGLSRRLLFSDSVFYDL
jgi:hypothetical protein